MGCKRRTALHQERGQEKIWKTIGNLSSILIYLFVCIVIVNILQYFYSSFSFNLELTIKREGINKRGFPRLKSVGKFPTVERKEGNFPFLAAKKQL